jgi:ketosteroid isomerase-like protein
VLGDVAYTTCTENWTVTMLGKTLSFSSNATNIFRRGPDGWKVIHHHADKAPSFEAVV